MSILFNASQIAVVPGVLTMHGSVACLEMTIFQEPLPVDHLAFKKSEMNILYMYIIRNALFIYVCR